MEGKFQVSLEAMREPRRKGPGHSKGLPQAAWDKPLRVKMNHNENRL